MTPAASLPEIESALRSRLVPFDVGELLAIVEDAWSLIADAPDPAAWATAFLEARRMVEVATLRQCVERN
jgi:hypothetical protein